MQKVVDRPCEDDKVCKDAKTTRQWGAGRKRGDEGRKDKGSQLRVKYWTYAMTISSFLDIFLQNIWEMSSGIWLRCVRQVFEGGSHCGSRD